MGGFCPPLITNDMIKNSNYAQQLVKELECITDNEIENDVHKYIDTMQTGFGYAVRSIDVISYVEGITEEDFRTLRDIRKKINELFDKSSEIYEKY